jgi:hypothetical protein
VAGALGCRTDPGFLPDAIQEVEVWRGVRDIHPEKRDLHVVGLLSTDGVRLLRQYISTGQPKRAGYVLSEFYLHAEDRIVGIVENSDGTLFGLDITAGDASKLTTTSTHLIITNDDTQLSSVLLRTIKKTQAHLCP